MTAFATPILLNSVAEEATRQGVNPDIAKAILLSENSSYGKDGVLRSNPKVDTDTVSPAGANGIMQVMPSTLNGLITQGYLSAQDDFTSPQGQIRAGVAAVKEMMKRGITKPNEIAVAYNGGPAALEAFRAGQPMNGETTDYLKKFSQHMSGSTGVAMDNPTPVSTSTSTTQREGFSTSQKVLPPGMAADLTRRTTEFDGLSQDLQLQLKTMSQGILSDNAAAKTAIDASTQAKIQETNAKFDVDKGVVDNRSNILHTFGIDINNDPDNIIARDITLARSAHSQRVDLQDQISALQTNNPLTNPVGWFVDSVKSLPLISRHNALVRQENTATQEIDKAQEQASRQTALQPPAIQDALQRQRLANINATLAGAEEEKIKLTGAARARVAQTLVEASSLARQDLTANFQLADIFENRTTSSFSDTDKITDRQKQENEYLKPVNAVVAQWNLPAFNPLTFKTLDKVTQDNLVKMAQFGRAGVSPGTAVSTLYDILGNNNLGAISKDAPDAGKFLSDVVASGYKELDTMEAKGSTDPKAMAQLRGAKSQIDKLAIGIDNWSRKKDEEVKGGNMANLSKDNPYKLNYSRVATDPTLADNDYAKAVIAKPINTIDDTVLLTLAAADVVNKKKDVGTAARELYDFYNKGIGIQQTIQAMSATGFKRMGDYPVIAKVYGLRSQRVDMMNPQSIENFLVSQIVEGKINGSVDLGVVRNMIPTN